MPAPWGVSAYLAGEEVSFLRYLAERNKGFAPLLRSRRVMTACVFVVDEAVGVMSNREGKCLCVSYIYSNFATKRV